MNPMIVLKNVTKVFGRETALSGVSLRVDPGEFVCISGPSGAGKTTILSLIIGADAPTSGAVELDGVDLRHVPKPALQLYRRRVGMIFQDLKLLPHRTVAENVAFPLEVCGVSDATIIKRVGEVLQITGLSGHAGALPHELSAGDRARAALARAIIHKPLIILADEPSGNMDPGQAVVILQILRHLQSQGMTVIVCTHDPALVDTLQTRVIRLQAGKVIRDGVGGYERAKKAQPKTPVAPGDHRFFSETDQEVAAKIDREEWGEGGKKVKITSIGS
ncbi:MAG: cell division transport system ATP-binding protein [Candidatus Peregrinibacteria bacterium Greene0416_19]|nr:MAG: cell division transport system ATP-binding protein [Candidatus Peregrinibacteria bacterium Greene0416_19]